MRYKICLFLLILVSTWNTHAQTLDTMKELNNVCTHLKDIKSMSYDFYSEVTFPNGNNDHINGAIYLNYDEKYLFNDCDAYTEILARHIFYKADHRKHEILFADLDRNYDKHLRRKTEEDIFNNSGFAKGIDTSMLHKSEIKEVTLSASGTLSVTLLLRDNNVLKKIRLQYDKNRDMPVSYNIEMTQQTTNEKGKKVQTVMKISCSHFDVGDMEHLQNYKAYFNYTKNKLELKKYKTYKIIPATR